MSRSTHEMLHSTVATYRPMIEPEVRQAMLAKIVAAGATEAAERRSFERHDLPLERRKPAS